jgi:3',5'-nucleoside bisphosphate phosphatase
MSPRAIAGRAEELGIDLIALTDHNSALNCPAFAMACRDFGRAALFGMEATTREEVHVLCLFDTVEKALALGERIYALLPDFVNDPLKLGDQVYVDVDDAILGEVTKYLGNAADISMSELEEVVLSMDGLYIPAHIDRPAFSVSSQLGFLPEGRYTAVEVLHYPPEIESQKFTVLTDSDAHYLEDIGRRTFQINADCRSLESLENGNLTEESYRAIRDALASGDVLLEV